MTIFLSAVGYRLDEIQGRHHRIFLRRRLRFPRPSTASFGKPFREANSSSRQFQRFSKDGTEIWIQATYNPIFGRRGEVTGVVKFATDITEIKQRNSEFESKVAAIDRSQAVIEFSLDGTILTANENFLNATGYTLQEVQGKHHRIFLLGELFRVARIQKLLAYSRGRRLREWSIPTLCEERQCNLDRSELQPRLRCCRASVQSG